jgi:uncharacterized protein YbjT (DUF2867 family)
MNDIDTMYAGNALPRWSDATHDALSKGTNNIMSQKILVTGATGTIGTHVVDELAKRGASVRAAARGASKASLPGGVEPAELDFADAASIDRALQGVSAAFLLTPFAADQVELGTRFIDRAKAAGVQRIVKLSAIGAEIEPGIQLGRWHRAIERHLETSGLEHTFLRPNNFMQNFVGYYPPDAEGTIYLPWGDGACSFIDGRDIGRVAAVALTDDGHAGKAYTLTGPAAFTIGEAAATLSSVTGRKIRYVDVPEAAARGAMLGLGMPAWMVDAMLELHAVDKAGYAAVVTDDVTKLTGTPARSFADFAKEHAASWKKKS